MPTYVALLRGINVGKNKRIAMADLRGLVEGLGYAGVKTHLNSGNVVFTGPAQPNGEIASGIEAAIRTDLGMEVPMVVRTGEEMQRVVAENPFPERAGDHTTLHVVFLSGVPDPKAVDALGDVDKGEDEYRVVRDNLYLSYPNRLTGAVFMPNGLDKALGVIVTSRNWRTVVKLAEMAAV
jgi:uncharacterized protein (DUF1697 family)